MPGRQDQARLLREGEKGHVISQHPKPHKELERGARVKLLVSRGKLR